MMAVHLARLSGIDPYTVDQMHMSPRFDARDEEPLYRYVMRKWRLREPAAFQAADGRWWHEGTDHDLKVFILDWLTVTAGRRG